MEPINNTNSKLGLAQYAVRPYKEEEDKLPAVADTYLPPTEPVKPTTPVSKGLASYAVKESLPKTESYTIEQVKADPEQMSKVRNMMSLAKGTDYLTKPADEVMKDFAAHMRFMSTNELSTAVEALNIATATDEEKATYGEAYKVWENVGSIFSNGDAFAGSLDYAQAILTSPSTWIGFGVGKMATSAGTKAAATGVITQATSAAVKAAAKKGVSEAGQKILSRGIVTQSAKATAKSVALRAAAVETVAAGFQDVVYQDIMMETSVQEEYSMAQTAVSTLLGASGALIPLGLHYKSQGNILARTGEVIDAASKTRASGAAKRASPQIKASLERAQADWAKLAEGGIKMDRDFAVRNTISDWFLNPNREDSFVRIMQKEGAIFDVGDDKFVRSVADYAMALDDEALESFNEALKPTGLKFGEALEILVASSKEAGQRANLASQAAKFAKDYQNVTVSKRNAAKRVVDGSEEVIGDDLAELPPKRVLAYLQSTWKKTLVSTWPTTMVNVKGWTILRSSRSMTDLILAAGYGGRGAVKKIVDMGLGSDIAAKDLGHMSALIKNQGTLFNNLLDPFLSYEAFSELLLRAPKKVQRQASQTLYGGIKDFTPEALGLSSKNPLIKGVEMYGDAAQKVSMVRLQDALTKGVSGLTELDKLSRVEFGIGLNELMAKGETWKITDDMWEKTIKTVLQDTLSEDLTRGSDWLSKAARMMEDVSNHPVGGFIIPFGRFSNSLIAFTWRHNPLAAVGPLLRVFKGTADEETGTAIARAMVGSTALAIMTMQESEKQKEGLQWFERRTDNGSIENVTTLFPYSLYALTGRIIHNYVQGEGMSPDLLEEFKKQSVILDTIENLGSLRWFKDFSKFLTDPAVEENEKNNFMDFLNGAFELANVVGAPTIAAGYTRPLDTLSRTLGYKTPEAGGGILVDRKQATGLDRTLQELSRYTSGFFNVMFGEENEYGVRMTGAPKESATSLGPVRGANPAGTVSGTNYQPRKTNFDRLLGMVDKSPYKADSYTTGNPEFDALVNKQITPLLLLRATEMLKDNRFLKAPQATKIKMVDQMIKSAEDDILDMLDSGVGAKSDDKLKNERRKLLVLDRQSRILAKNALGISTPDRELTLYQIEAIRRYIDVEEAMLKRMIK